MKKILSIAMCLLLSFAPLTGCSQAAPASGGATSTPADRADANINWQYKTAEETKNMLDAQESIIILDIRPDDMYSKGHIPGAYHVPGYPVDTPELEQVLKDAVPNLQGDKPIVIVCKSGNKGAKRSISLFVEEGIAPERLFILEGGGDGWNIPEYTTTVNDSTVPN